MVHRIEVDVQRFGSSCNQQFAFLKCILLLFFIFYFTMRRTYRPDSQRWCRSRCNGAAEKILKICYHLCLHAFHRPLSGVWTTALLATPSVSFCEFSHCQQCFSGSSVASVTYPQKWCTAPLKLHWEQTGVSRCAHDTWCKNGVKSETEKCPPQVYIDVIKVQTQLIRP